MAKEEKTIYETLNEAASKVGVKYDLNENSSFSEVRAAFEEIINKVDEQTKRKLQLDYMVYVAVVQYNKNNNVSKEKSGKEVAADLKGVFDDTLTSLNLNEKIEPPKPSLRQRGIDEDFKEDYKILSKNKRTYVLDQEQRKTKEVKKTKNLNNNLKKHLVKIVIAGLVVAAATGFMQTHFNKPVDSAIENTSIVQQMSNEEATDTQTVDEPEMLPYVLQYGDYSKDKIANRLGIDSNDLEIVGEFSKTAGDTITIKILDQKAAENYKYYNVPSVNVEYDYHIERGTSSLIMVAAEMMAEKPLLEEYYWSYDNPANQLALDLASQPQNKDIIKSTSLFTDGDISIKLKITEDMANKYNISKGSIQK